VLLLKESGCIAVSGGLEVASDRLLGLINKGVSVEKVAKVADNFTRAGIMVHAYLMYGFPTQTAQETIDSLEVVRQLFEAGVVQSGFWHRFAMTVHSPVGQNPEKFKTRLLSDKTGTFANNDLEFTDPTVAATSFLPKGSANRCSTTCTAFASISRCRTGSTSGSRAPRCLLILSGGRSNFRSTNRQAPGKDILAGR
jgi:hypothetical protein